MFKLNKYVLVYFVVLLFSPFISYYTFGVYQLPSSTYYFQIIAVFFAVFYYYADFLNRKFDKRFLFLFLYTIYTTIWSFYNATFEKKGFANTELLTNLSTLAILFIIQNTIINERFIKISITLIKITSIIAAIVSMIQVFDPTFLDSSAIRLPIEKTLEGLNVGELYQDRRSSIFGFVDSNELGLSFLPLLAVLIGHLIFQNKKKESLIYLIAGGITSVLSNGRYVIVGFILITFLYLFNENRKISYTFKYIFIMVAVGFVFYYLLLLIGYDVYEWIDARLLKEGSIQKTTRWGALENFLIFFPRSILLGTGVHLTAEMALAVAFVGSSQIHVGYLQHLVSYGLIGSILLFSFWFLILRKFFINATISNYWGAFIGFSIFLWANSTLVMYSIFYYGIIYAFIFDKYYYDSKNDEENQVN